MARSSDSDEYRRSSKRRRKRSSSRSSSSTVSSGDDRSDRRRKRRSRSRRRSRDRSRDRRDRSRDRTRRSRSRRRSSSYDRQRDRRRDKKRRSRSRSAEYSRRRRSRSASFESRRDRRKDDRNISPKETTREPFVFDALTEVERSKEIESINSSGFAPRNFVARRDQPCKTDEKPTQDAHVSAMFSTTTLEEFLADQAKKPVKITSYADTPELLMHDDLMDDPEKAKEKWRKKLYADRRRFLSCKTSITGN